MTSSRQRSTKKENLISRIQYQRITLAQCKEDFLTGTVKIDKRWQAVFRMRALVGVGLAFILLNATKRNPSLLYSLSRRAIAAWSASRLIKRKWIKEYF